MNRNEKKDWISDLNAELTSSESLVVASFKGLTVGEISELRNEARKLETSIKVTQNRLTKLALKDTNYEGLTDLFKGVTLVAWSKDPILASKVIHNFAKTNNKLEILGGVMGQEILDAAGVKSVAMLPTLDEARSQICAMLTAVPSKVARVFNAYAEKEAA